MLAKRRHLEEFIAKNKARASTATLRRSPRASSSKGWKSIEIAGDEPTADIRAPLVEPRKGPALRCRDLAIGYPERQIAARHRPGDRPRLAGGDRRRQRPGQDDVPADRRRFAASRSPAKSAGATAARSASTPSTSTPACPRSRRCWTTCEDNAASGTKDAGDSRPGRGVAVSRRRT